MVLDNDLVGVHTQRLSLDVTADVVVGHADAELDVSLHIYHTAVRVILGVNLPREDLVGGDGRHHVRGSAVDGDVVAGAELEGSPDVPDDEEWILYLRQRGARVVGQSTHSVSGVPVVKAVTPVRSRETQISARLHGGHIL